MTRTGNQMSCIRTTTGLVALSTAVGCALAFSASAAGAAAQTRPAIEHVPVSIHDATVTYSSTSVGSNGGEGQGRAVPVHGAKATRLVKLFDGLKLEPRNTIHCDIAGGPTTTVSFQGAHHLWKATESACTDVQVTRDGKPLPTLLPSKAWSAAISKDLGN
jgi:hypothetical protein